MIHTITILLDQNKPAAVCPAFQRIFTKVWLEIHFSTQTGGGLPRFPAAFHKSLVRNSFFYTNSGFSQKFG